MFKFYKKNMLAVLSVANILLFCFPQSGFGENNKGDWPEFMKDDLRSSASELSLNPPLTLDWKFKTAGPVYSSPVVSDGVVFFGSNDQNFYAVDVKTGKKVWSYKTGGTIVSSAVVKKGVVYFGSKDGYLYALESKKGKLKWQFNAKTAITSAPAVGEKMVYVASQDVLLYGIDLKDGKMKFRRKLTEYKYSGVYSNPLFDEKRNTIYTANKLGELYALTAEGKTKWAFLADSSIYASPVIKGDTLFIGSFDKFIYAIDLSKKEFTLKWTKELGDKIYSSTAVHNGVFVGSQKGLFYALDEDDGSELWKMEFSKSVNSSMAITADNIGYVGCEDGNIYGVDLDEGRIIWSYSTSGGIHSSPLITNGFLIFGSKDGNLYALKEEKEGS